MDVGSLIIGMFVALLPYLTGILVGFVFRLLRVASSD